VFQARALRLWSDFLKALVPNYNEVDPPFRKVLTYLYISPPLSAQVVNVQVADLGIALIVLVQMHQQEN
jgi:hypothetical protein